MQSTIVVLKSGETIITNLQEVYSGEGDEKKGICLMLNYPYKVSIHLPEKKRGKPVEGEVQVELSKWCPFSIDIQFKIPYDSVLSIGKPEPKLEEAYKIKVDQYKLKQQVNEEVQEYSSDVSVIGAGVQ